MSVLTGDCDFYQRTLYGLLSKDKVPWEAEILLKGGAESSNPLVRGAQGPAIWEEGAIWSAHKAVPASAQPVYLRRSC